MIIGPPPKFHEVRDILEDATQSRGSQDQGDCETIEEVAQEGLDPERLRRQVAADLYRSPWPSPDAQHAGHEQPRRDTKDLTLSGEAVEHRQAVSTFGGHARTVTRPSEA